MLSRYREAGADDPDARRISVWSMMHPLDDGAAMTDQVLSPVAARRVFLALTFTRWFPVGLIAGLLTLLALERGLTVAEALTAFALMGFVVFALELPTSGFADAFGRRPVFVAAAVVNVLVGVRLPVRQLGLGLRLCCGADGGLPGAGLRPAGGVVRRHRPCHRAGRRRRPGPRCPGHGPRRLDGGGALLSGGLVYWVSSRKSDLLTMAK